jgi:hypothetical protein
MNKSTIVIKRKQKVGQLGKKSEKVLQLNRIFKYLKNKLFLLEIHSTHSCILERSKIIYFLI